MFDKIIRNLNVLNDRKDLVRMKSIKSFPVFMGVTKKNIKKDKKFDMNFYISKSTGITPVRKSSSIGQGGRGRSVKIAMSTMNKSKKRSHKRYRGQGR